MHYKKTVASYEFPLFQYGLIVIFYPKIMILAKTHFLRVKLHSSTSFRYSSYCSYLNITMSPPITFDNQLQNHLYGDGIYHGFRENYTLYQYIN